MNSLISFGKNDKSRHLILDAFPSIMAILNISTSTIFGDIASLLASLAGENEIRKKIATSQFFGRVVTAASEQESYTLMKVCADLVEYQDIRSTTTLENVLSMFWRFIGNSWWHSEATQNILALSEFSDLDGTDIQAAITAPHVQAEILSSLNNAHWGIRVRTLQAIITLSSNQGLRPGFITPGILRRVVSMADDEDEDVREATLNVFVVLSQHGDIRSTAIMPEIQHIVSKLGDGDSGVRQGTLKALVAFCQHEDARVRISHPTIMQYIASFLQSTSWYVRRTTVEVFGALATYDEEDIHVAIRRKETIQKIIPLLGDADVDVRQATLESVFALVKNDTPFAEMATQEMKTKIISMLDDPEDTRQATLWSIVNLIEHDVFAAAISTPEMLQKIISLTDDKDEDVRETALVAIGAFARQPTLLSSVATPAVCGKLLLLLHDEDWNVLQATLVAIGVISKQDDARKVLAIGDGLQNIVKLVDDGDSDVRCAAMECVAAFLSYDKMPAMDITETEKHDKLEIMKSGILSKIFAMVEDEDQDIRIAALNGIAILSRHKVVREHILKTRVLPKIASAAPEDGGGVGPAKLRIAVALTEYADGRAAIAVPEIMVKIVPMLVDADAGTVRDTIAAFSRHDEVHAGIMTPKVLQEMLSALVDEDGDVRQHLVDAIVTLSNHDSGRRAISTMTTIIPMLGRLKDLKNGFQKVITGITEDVKVRTKLAQPEMIEKIGAMLGDQGQSSARKGALDTVVTLAKYDDIRKSIFRMEIIPKVLLRLKDSDANVQKHALESIVALEGIVALAHHSTISPSIATPDTMTKIISLLSEAVKDNLVIRESVVYAVGYFAARVLDADDDVGMRADMINLVSTPQAMQNIGALLVDSDVNVRDKSLHCLRVLLKHDPVKAILLTPNWMVQFVEMLDGRDGDHHVLQLIGSLLEQPDDVSALGTALIQKPLQQIPNTNLYLRKSYTDLIVTLPSSFTFSSNDTDKLVSLLKSPNIAVFQSAVLIVMHFVTNAQFQQDVLKSDIWAELLQRQDTAMMVPAILAEFTLSGKIRVDSALGVVPELLNMFAAGPSDFERWQVGLKDFWPWGYS
ncbi:armadillo-type protein, partial [Mycena leptocephala]